MEVRKKLRVEREGSILNRKVQEVTKGNRMRKGNEVNWWERKDSRKMELKIFKSRKERR